MTEIFRVGDLDIVCVSDGLLTSSLDNVIGLDRDAARDLSGAAEDGSLVIPVNNFVFDREGARLLVDAGSGNTMQPTLGRLPHALREAGRPPETITHIVLTHLHPDHANGLVDDALEAVFPNAELVIHEAELSFWIGPDRDGESDKLKRTRLRNQTNVKPYLDRIRTMREGESFLGCSPILAGGHTPGHTCWRIETGGAPLMAWGDLVHFSDIQIPRPETAVTYDLDADRARTSRLRMFETIARDGITIMGAHVAAPGIGSLSRDGDRYRFTPASR